jgi:transposase-like protein
MIHCPSCQQRATTRDSLVNLFTQTRASESKTRVFAVFFSQAARAGRVISRQLWNRFGHVTNQYFSGTLASHAKSVRRKPLVCVPVQCPYCQSTEVIKAGKQANGAQRYQCQNEQCERRIFLLQYQDRGRIPEIRRQVIDLALNGSGIRDTARVLRISPTTVIAVLKKSPHASTRQPHVAASSSYTRRPRLGRTRSRAR